MKKVVDDPRLMIKVCDLYYNQDASQQQIGKQLGLSRPTVARLLASAREQQIVEIRIPGLETLEYWELEKKLEAQYGLREVLVVASGDSQEDTEKALGNAAAGYLQYLIKDGDIVGVSMGTTLYHMVSAIEAPKAEDVTFVPLIGGMGRLRTELHAGSLAEKLSRMFDGAFVPLHAPARVSGRQIREELMKEESLLSAIVLFGKLDVALVGIGYPNEHSAIQATGYFKANELESLIKRRAAGELCMQFYDDAGDTAPFRGDNNVVGIDIHRLRKVPRSVGIAGGTDKLPAILGAVRGRYINTLITDVGCARALASKE
ncbi:MAG: sugar-binding transcriptional regulator [Dorea sp.]|jgi:deoxyribonucleoside regulator|nr:sugar-binding transcriptional regulator [Dorea sp.]